MSKIMIKKSFLLIIMIMVLSGISCVKETYNMKMLSKKQHLSPTMAISAVKGDISLSDIVKTSDTVIFDHNKLVIIVYKKDSVVDLKLTDFSKGVLPQMTAIITPDSIITDLDNILRHITGDFLVSNPSIKFTYSNSYADPLKVDLRASGKRNNKTVDLNLAPFLLTRPNTPVQQFVTDSFQIDKTNSALKNIISLPPEVINFSGTVIINPSGKSGINNNYVLGTNHLVGSIELSIPLEFRTNNLQFTDTVDNFIKSDGGNNTLKPEDFQLLHVKVDAKNGFPLGVSLKMSLYDSKNTAIIDTISAKDILKPAPVDSNGKSNGVTETSTTIEFTRKFFSSVKNADKIIFQFTLITTGNGDVKIYSDYRIKFNAALVIKPDINLN